MKLIFKRLLHSAKLQGGNVIGKFLRHLFIKRKGAAGRLYQALASSQPLAGCSSRVLIQPTSLPIHEPQFFIDGATEQKYLERLVNQEYNTVPAAGIISANHVDVSFPVGMHLWHGKLFEEALLGIELLTNPKYFLDVETIPFRRKANFPEAILLSLPWHHNFYHWMIEILPRLVLFDLAEDLHHLKLVVPKSSPKFVKESLYLAGYENQVSFVEDGVYRFERLHILSRLAKTASISPHAIEWLTHKIKVSDVETSKKRVYVSRSDARIRYITNELDVQSVLSDFGFETVVMSNYTLAEQIRIFQQAEVVVGSHGAAFAHIASMAPETTFMEFFESGHFNRCFYSIACLKKLKYGFLVGQKDGLGFSVDVTQLKTLLRQALG